MSKFAFLILAISFSFFLFVGMTYLIKPKALEVEEITPGPPVTITIKVEDDDPKTRTRIPPRPTIKPKPKPEIAVTTIDTDKTANLEPLFERVAFNQIKGIEATIFNTSLGGSVDGDARPRVRINPTYPEKAKRNGIEGFVILSFDISELGRPMNVTVVKSNPRGVFEKQARRALRKWKYDPKMVDEKAVIQTNQTVTLAFEFEKNSGML